MTQLYGIAFQSPLITRSLIPPKLYTALYLDHQATPLELSKDKGIQDAVKLGKPIVLAAGGLQVLQHFVKMYPPNENAAYSYKVVLHEFPGQIHPYLDPLITWLDCDHQAGGAWQITKLKFAEFENLLNSLDFFDATGLELVQRMSPFAVREKHQELQKVTELLSKEAKARLNQTKTLSDILQAPEEKRGRRGRKSLEQAS